MTDKDLKDSLNELLFKPFRRELSQQAKIIISLCCYYGNESLPEEIQTELIQLNAQRPMLVALETLLGAIDGQRLNDFRWDPKFYPEHTPEHLSLNPTFNVQRGDDGAVVQEIKMIRLKLDDHPVNLPLLISYIVKMAKEAGDLSFEQNT